MDIGERYSISSSLLLELATHEAYPGHHTEHACKDAELAVDRGYAELGVYVYPTPQSLLSEGIACYASEALLGDEAEEVAARWLRPLGIPFDVETSRAVREAALLLLAVRPNIAIMLDEEGAGRGGACVRPPVDARGRPAARALARGPAGSRMASVRVLLSGGPRSLPTL